MAFLNRRRFLGTFGATLAVSSSLVQEQSNAYTSDANTSRSNPQLADSLPSLQCPSETGITAVWAVAKPSAGYVQFGTDKNNLDQIAYGDLFGRNAYSRRFLQIRIEELKPNTKYFYRTATCPFQFVNAYTFKRSEPVFSEIYSFETSGAAKDSATFSIINDTHSKQPLLKTLGEKLRTLNHDYTIWNGDLADYYNDEQTAVDSVLKPGGSGFAMEKPILFVPGNHDYRGEWAYNLPLCLPPWETQSENPSLGRNFVVRTGPLAIIGLDTGEDKPDNRPEWAGLSRFEPYRIKQRDWLEKALQSRQVATAPFVIACCHIPIFDSRPQANGGDLPTGYASFQRQAGELWGPLLSKAGVQAVISAHTHRVRCDEAEGDRSWAQIVGGGNNLERDVTVIHGKADSEKLEIVIDSIGKNEELGRWTFWKRKN